MMRLRVLPILVRMLLFACLTAAVAPLAGCWDMRYLDKLAVVLAVGVDDDPTGKFLYQVTVQVVLPQNAVTGEKGGGGSPVMTITDTGDTLFEVFRKMSTKTSRRLFFSHTQLLAIHEMTARRGIYPLMDLIERNADIRTDISVIIARGMTAEKLLQIRTQMESVPANQLKEMLQVNEEAQGQTYSVLVRDIARWADSEQKQASVPAIGAKGLPSKGNTKENVDRINPEVIPELTTMAVFKDGKLLDFLTPRQSRGMTWLENKIKSTVIKFSCPRSKGHYMVEVFETETKTMAKLPTRGEDRPVIHIKTRVEAGIQEMACPDFFIEGEESIHEVEQALKKAVEEELKTTIAALQKKLKSDALGWGEAVYQDQPQLWKKISPDWSSLFPKTAYEIECISHIQSMGSRTNSIVK